jgi:hypothetical protein
MQLGNPELVIGSLAILLLFSGRITTLFTGRSVQEILGTRTLTFGRMSDIVAGLVIVATWLVTFLFLGHR